MSENSTVTKVFDTKIEIILRQTESCKDRTDSIQSLIVFWAETKSPAEYLEYKRKQLFGPMRCPSNWFSDEDNDNYNTRVLNDWHGLVNNLTLRQVIDDLGGDKKVSHNNILNTELCLGMLKDWLHKQGLTSRDTPLLLGYRRNKM